jgi:prepilin-type N-terminal cleavage/methylation domain-containing protein
VRTLPPAAARRHLSSERGPGASRRPGSRQGFTLIELTIVLFIMALFAVLTLPMVTGIGENGLDVSARRLAGSIQYLYNQSALSGLQYRLVFNLDQETYGAKRLEKDGTLAPVTGIGREHHLDGDVRFDDVTIPGKGKFTTGKATMTIYPIGWMDETIVHLDNGKGKKLTLRIKPLTGSTEVYEGYRDFS